MAQPTAGLTAMTDAVATSFAKVLNGYEQQGAIMMIEFGHEMNGDRKRCAAGHRVAWAWARLHSLCRSSVRTLQ